MIKILFLICLSLIAGCSSNQIDLMNSGNIDLKNSDIIWKYDLNFYSLDLHNIFIEDSLLIIRHYQYNYSLKEYLEDIISINKASGELIEYSKSIDTLKRKEIESKEMHNKYVNRSKWPVAFKINPKFEIEIKVENKSLFRHKTDYHYEVELELDDEIYTLNLDDLNINHIMYYLIYSNELYIVFSPNPKVITELKNTIYKIDLDKIIKKYIEQK